MSSDEPLVGEAAEQAAHGYVPMGEVTAPEPESASGDGPLTEWAKRREAEGEARLHTVERNYIQLDGEHAGEPAPENQTLSIERASRDLTNMRAWEAQQAQAEADKRLAVEVDQMRSPLQAPVQQQEHEQKQEAPPVEVQPETPQEVTGADPELVKLITENPKLRTALEAESARVEAARQEYAQGLQRNSAAAYAALFSEYPEVAQLAPGSFPQL